MSEKELLNEIQLAVTGMGSRLFRNNVGVGWQGRMLRPTRSTTVKIGPGDIVLRHARPLHAGLCVGSSDLIGWTPVIITPEMVGHQVAIFTAIEVKTGVLQATKEQFNFVIAVNKSGGKAGIVRDLGGAYEVINGF